MTEIECDLLIDRWSNYLGISQLLTSRYREEIYSESDGHPYVIKILLGEVSKSGRTRNVERIIATREEILNALFERTYSDLSPVAKRVFLTLCNWRSAVPKVALEAVLLRPTNERMDVGSAIDELGRFSFIELSNVIDEAAAFITVPLAAQVFGKRKLNASPLKMAAELDCEYLRMFGASQQADIRRGVGPTIDRLIRQIAQRINGSTEQLAQYRPIVELLGNSYPSAWLGLAAIYEEIGDQQSIDEAEALARRFLEGAGPPDKRADGWEMLVRLARGRKNYFGEVHALIELSLTEGVTFDVISSSANRLNALLREQVLEVDSDERRILATKLVRAMESRVDEASAVDLSRLAWLCLHLRDQERALHYTERGLQLDPEDEHCRNLFQRLRT